MYSKELQSIIKSNRFRTRDIFDESLIDLASNDYLGLTSKKNLLKKSYKSLLKNKYHAPKASMLVNGYSNIHRKFEKKLAKANGFEDGVCVGSGFLANISLVEALVRNNDTLFIDEDYHASGILATKLLRPEQVVVFKHNDHIDLENKLQENTRKGRNIIAIEGVYSMEGDLAPKEIFEIADKQKALLVVDEAHSSGVIGENLLGIYDYYNIKIKDNHIKMGTLGKAYGSYGAYILSSKEIIDYLTNRAKPIIYSTAPSNFDITLGYESLKYIIKNKKNLKKKINKKLQIIKEILNIDAKSLIIPIKIGDNKKVKDIQKEILKAGFVVGAIRQPTVKIAIIRLIAKIDVSNKQLKEVCKILKKYTQEEK